MVYWYAPKVRAQRCTLPEAMVGIDFFLVEDVHKWLVVSLQLEFPSIKILVKLPDPRASFSSCAYLFSVSVRERDANETGHRSPLGIICDSMAPTP